MKCIAVKEECHGYIRLYPHTPDNCAKIAAALAKLCDPKEVSFNGCEQSFSSIKRLEAALRVSFQEKDIESLNEDFYSFGYGEINDFKGLPDDYFGF